jgi:hypothetical protein
MKFSNGKTFFFFYSLNKLHAAVKHGSHEDKAWYSDLGNSNWLFHIRVCGFN